MLSELPAGTIEGWIEYYKLEPWGDDWERASLIATTIVNTASMMAPHDGEPPPDIPQDAFVPFRKHKNPQDELIEQAAAGLETLEF